MNHCFTPIRLVFQLALMATTLTSAPAETDAIQVWPGAAPGSEDWKHVESTVDWRGEKRVRNVVDPTMIPFLPKPSKATGTAVIVAPGGGFRFLSWESEGTRVAEWLAEYGIAAFVLKYRLMNTGPTQSDFLAALDSPARQGLLEMMRPAPAGTKCTNSPARMPLKR